VCIWLTWLWSEGPKSADDQTKDHPPTRVCSFAHQALGAEGAMRKDAPSPLGIGFRSHVHPRMPLRSSYGLGACALPLRLAGALSAAPCARIRGGPRRPPSCLSNKKRQAPEPRSDPPRCATPRTGQIRLLPRARSYPRPGLRETGAPRDARGVVATRFCRRGPTAGQDQEGRARAAGTLWGRPLTRSGGVRPASLMASKPAVVFSSI
jgi:hypothetical protein